MYSRSCLRGPFRGYFSLKGGRCLKCRCLCKAAINTEPVAVARRIITVSAETFSSKPALLFCGHAIDFFTVRRKKSQRCGFSLFLWRLFSRLVLFDSIHVTEKEHGTELNKGATPLLHTSRLLFSVRNIFAADPVTKTSNSYGS